VEVPVALAQAAVALLLRGVTTFQKLVGSMSQTALAPAAQVLAALVPVAGVLVAPVAQVLAATSAVFLQARQW